MDTTLESFLEPKYNNTRTTYKKGKKFKQVSAGIQISHQRSNFNLKTVLPLTQSQESIFKFYREDYNLLIHGFAGTGKGYVSLYLALNEVLSNNNDYERVMIVRSIVPTRDPGALPGNLDNKLSVYEQPYSNICSELFGRGDAYEILKSKKIIQFISTSFIRGTTFNNCIVLVDEINNLNGHELDSVITRVGNNCKIVFMGDYTQSDFTKSSDKQGMLDFIKVIKKLDNIKFIEMGENDIVRSAFVKNYIIAKHRLGIQL